MRVDDGPQALLQVADLRGLEEREAAHDRVGDALVAQAGDDGFAVPVLAVEHRKAAPVGLARRRTARLPAGQGLDAVDDLACLVLEVGGHDQLDRGTASSCRAQDLVRFVAQGVARDEAVGDREHGLEGAEVILEAEPGRRARRPRARVMRRWAAEAAVELHEGCVAGAAEAVDGLVVVTHDHDVVRPVRRAAEQLDELDLGDVGILELVHEHMAEGALVAAQDVGLALEELRDEADLLAEVDGAAPGQLVLVGLVDDGQLPHTHDLQGRSVLDVARRQGLDAGVVGRVEFRAAVGPAVTPERAACLAVGGLLDRLDVRGVILSSASPVSAARSARRSSA